MRAILIQIIRSNYTQVLFAIDTLEKSDGEFDAKNGQVNLDFEAKARRMEGEPSAPAERANKGTFT